MLSPQSHSPYTHGGLDMSQPVTSAVINQTLIAHKTLQILSTQHEVMRGQEKNKFEFIYQKK